MNVIIDLDGTTQQSSSAFFSPLNNGIDTTTLKVELEKMQQENDALKVSGRSARPIIKKYSWLGVNINGNNPYVGLEVEILPKAAASFSSKVKGVIAETSVEKYQPGKELYMKYDNSKAIIDRS